LQTRFDCGRSNFSQSNFVFAIVDETENLSAFHAQHYLSRTYDCTDRDRYNCIAFFRYDGVRPNETRNAAFGVANAHAQRDTGVGPDAGVKQSAKGNAATNRCAGFD
jgi:hypothetical protein